MARLLGVSVLLLSASAAAKCAPFNTCLCGSDPEWVAVVHFSSDAGTTIEAISRADGADAGIDAGSALEVLATWGPTNGARYLVPSSAPEQGSVVPIGSDGSVRCLGTVFEAGQWTRSLLDKSCEALVASTPQPACRDTFPFCGCAVADAGAPFAALLLLLWRGRRRA